MAEEIQTISLSIFFRMGSVNCYLIATGTGYVLIDTCGSNVRKELAWKLDEAGCKHGLLKLIILTHGDFDHTGNAAYLRNTFGGKIGMHPDDAGMLVSGDMFVGRQQPNRLVKKVLPLFAGFGKSERITPDLLLQDGDRLNEYGMDARIVSIPGHTKGSIGILTASGNLFCGDLLVSSEKPMLNSLIDDLAAANASLQYLRSMDIRMVYPGHGKPFPLEFIEEGVPSAA